LQVRGEEEGEEEEEDKEEVGMT